MPGWNGIGRSRRPEASDGLHAQKPQGQKPGAFVYGAVPLARHRMHSERLHSYESYHDPSRDTTPG